MRFSMKQGAVALVAAAALPIAGCSPSGAGGGAASSDVVLGAILAPATLDANNMNWGNQSIYAQAVYDSLLRADTNGVDVKPGLATKWEYNATKTVLTLTLRSDVTFTDGSKFTADVAAKNIERFKNGSSPQRNKAANIKSVKAIDDTTLQVTLGYADPAFLVYLTQNPGLMESAKAFTNPDIATNPVGSGPYTLDKAGTVVGSTYTFKKNPKYWDPSIQHYNKLTIKVFTDNTSMLNALRGKQLNAAALADNSILPQVEAAGYKTNPLLLSMVALFLWDRGGKLAPALGDVRVRQAINYALDTKSLLKNVGLGYGKLTQQPFRPESAAFDEALNSTYSYDPAKAKQLLAQAGYGSGFDLSMPSNPSIPASLQAIIQQQLGNVGIRVKFTDVGQNLIPDIQKANYPASYFQLQQDPVNSQLINFMIAPNATWNPFKYADPKADALIARVRAGGADGDAGAKELNKYVVEQAWFAPWFTTQTSFMTDAKTKVTVNQDNAYPYLQDIEPAA